MMPLFSRGTLGIALLLSAASAAARPGWVTNGPPLTRVNTVSASVSAVPRLYAIGSSVETAESAIFESTDGGDTWQSVVEAPQGDYYSEVFVDPRDTRRLFAGTQTAGGNTNLYRSTDQGDNWSVILTISTACVPSFAPGIGADTLLVACGNRFFRTRDLGLTWSEPPAPSTETTKLTAGPASAVFAYGATRIFRSTTDGDAWTEAGGAPAACPGILSLRVDPANAAHYLAGTGLLGAGGFQCGGVFTTGDSGGTWTAGSLSGVYVTDVRLDPTNANGAYACASFIVGILPRGGVWQSVDDGLTWQNLRLPVDGAQRLAVSPNGHVYAATSQGVYGRAIRTTRRVGPR